MEWTMMVLSKFLFFYFLGNQTKTEKELRNDFAWVWGWGLWNLWFFLMVFLCWIFWVYEFYLLEVSWLIERWENLGLSYDFVYLGFVVWENLRRSVVRFVFGWQERARKCKKIWTCVLMFKIWVSVLWSSCWRWS